MFNISLKCVETTYTNRKTVDFCSLACIQNAEDEENRLALAELMERALADFVPSSKPN